MDSEDFDMWTYIGNRYPRLVHYRSNRQNEPRERYNTEDEALAAIKEIGQLKRAMIAPGTTFTFIAVPCFQCKHWHIRPALDPATEARFFVESLGIQARW